MVAGEEVAVDCDAVEVGEENVEAYETVGMFAKGAAAEEDDNDEDGELFVKADRNRILRP